MTKFELERQIAIRAVSAACQLTRRLQTDLIINKTQSKSDASPVTIADYAVQGLIVSKLIQQFPGHRFIAEESSAQLLEDKSLLEIISREIALSEEIVIETLDKCSSDGKAKEGEYSWVLDPIDGTKGFISFRQFCIALALLDDKGEVQLGVLGCPNLPMKAMTEAVNGSGAVDEHVGVIFHAVKNDGTYMIKDDIVEESKFLSGGRLQVSNVMDPLWATFCESVETGHSSHELSARVASILGVTTPPVRMDSQAKYGCMARGDASIFLRFPRKGYVENIWDSAPASIILEEAGGKVTDGKGNRLDFSLGRKMNNEDGIVATNGYFHDKVISAVQKAMNEEGQ